MTDDLVKRLRSIDADQICTGCYTIVEAADEAATRIEKLEAALAKIAQHDMQAIAMDALRPGERIRETVQA